MTAMWFESPDEGFCEAVSDFARRDMLTVVEGHSRNGRVWYCPEPVCFKNSRPDRRVLFNTARNCNPFFHLYEAFWMLAGRNDVASLAWFNKRMKEFSGDGKTFHGAYGRRWRGHYKFDQLRRLTYLMENNPQTRRAVLSMWDADCDLQNDESCPDVPCNTQVMFAIDRGKLNMTVINRSNDLVWGLLGANLVHMSFLMEYISCALNVPKGTLFTVSNNVHVYEWNWEPEKWLARRGENWYYDHEEFTPTPLFERHRREEFDAMLQHFMAYPPQAPRELATGFYWLDNVLHPAIVAWNAHKKRDYTLAEYLANQIREIDWRVACLNWLSRVAKLYEERDPSALHEEK